MNKIAGLVMMASVAGVGTLSTPAAAQGRYYDDGRYETRYDNRDYAERRYYDRGRFEYRNRDYERCKARKGTTGTVLGAVLGGLLGREIGRGSRYNAPSTTGLILGAGAGALAGRAGEKNIACQRYR